jgi:hypothetical protein
MAKKIKMHGQEVIAIEDLVDIKYIISFENTGGQNVGALLLERNGQLMLKFCFGTSGIHNDITIDQAISIISQLREIIKDMPLGETLTIDRSNFPDWLLRYQELEDILDRNGDHPSNGLIHAEQSGLIEASTSTTNRKRNKPLTTIWPTITSKALEEKLDIPSKILHNAELFVKSISGQLAQEKSAHVGQFVDEAWKKYMRWHDILTIRLNSLQKLHAYTAPEIWAHLWLELNRSNGCKAPKIPHLLRVDVQTGSIEEISDPDDTRNTKAILFSSPLAISKNNPGYIYQDGKYIVSAALQKHCGAWGDHDIDQLNWMADHLANTTDTRVVVEFGRALQDSVTEKLRNFSGDAIKGMDYSARKGKSLVRDEEELIDAADAERAIVRGSTAVVFGLVFFFHADELKDCLDAGRKMIQRFGTDGKTNILQLEVTACQQNWYQSLPITMSHLLEGTSNPLLPHDRRMQVNSEALPVYIPLASPSSTADEGIEFTSKFGDVPIYLDTQNQKFKGHGAIFGQPRESGKTVLGSMITSQMLAYGRYCTIINISKSKEIDSYIDYAKLMMHGELFDIVDSSYNFMTPPSRPASMTFAEAQNSSEWKDIVKSHESFIRQVLLAAVLGADLKNDKFDTGAVDSVLTQLLATFFGAGEIQMRFRDAKKGGLGSEAWANTPTVVDFVEKYCGIERMIGRTSDEDRRIVDHIRSRLTSWFVTANCLAPSLAKPSSFESESRLLVISLRDFANNDEAAVYGLVAQGLAFRRAIKYMKEGTFLFNDENKIAMKFPSLARGLGSLHIDGGKANMIIWSAMQPPDTITASAAAAEIQSSLRYIMVGKIPAGTERIYAEHLELPVEHLKRCSDIGWGVNAEGGYSSWLFSQDGHCCFIKAEPQKALLNVMRSYKDEIDERRERLTGISDPIEVFQALQNA